MNDQRIIQLAQVINKGEVGMCTMDMYYGKLVVCIQNHSKVGMTRITRRTNGELILHNVEMLIAEEIVGLIEIRNNSRMVLDVPGLSGTELVELIGRM